MSSSMLVKRCSIIDCSGFQPTDTKMMFKYYGSIEKNAINFLWHLYDSYECPHRLCSVCRLCGAIIEDTVITHILVKCDTFQKPVERIFSKEARMLMNADNSRSYTFWITYLCNMLPQFLVTEIDYHEIFDVNVVIYLQKDTSMDVNDMICNTLSIKNINPKCVLCGMYYDSFPTYEQCSLHLASGCPWQPSAVSP